MENKSGFHPNPQLTLMDQVKKVLRYYHYAYRTEETYCQWILRYIPFYGGKTHPRELGSEPIERFLSHLTVQGNVAASTQRQALNALVFLYRRVLDIQLSDSIAPIRSKRQKRPPVVLTSDKVQQHIARITAPHEQDVQQGFGEVYLPNALPKKYPAGARESGWQYVFPAKKRSIDPRSGVERRHHVMESGLQKAVKRAAGQAEIHKRAGCHTLGHSFATHMFEKRVNIRVLQELLGHADVKTTEIYTHVMDKSTDSLANLLDG